MSNISKPTVLPVWGTDATVEPDILTPSGAMLLTGWPHSDQPPERGYFNWAFKYLMNGVRYQSQKGLPTYDTAEEYQANCVVVSPVDGHVYMARRSHAAGAGDPSDHGSVWQRIDEPWENPGFADLLGGDLIDTGTGASGSPPIYGQVFNSPKLAERVYTKGRGLVLGSTGADGNTEVTIGAGMLGFGVGTSTPSTTPVVSWTFCIGGSVYLDAPASGKERWDMVVATRLANHTSDANAIAFSVIKGGEVNNGSLDDFPSYYNAQGGSVLGYARIRNTGGTVNVIAVADCVCHVGSPAIVHSQARHACWLTTYANNGVQVNAASTVDFFPPGEFVDGNARLIGFDLGHQLPAGTTVTVGSITLGTNSPGFTALKDVSSALTFNDTSRQDYVPLGGPNLGPSTPLCGPVWSNGLTKRTPVVRNGHPAQVALRIHTPAGPGVSLVYGITWYFLKE